MQCCVDFHDSCYAYTSLTFSVGRTGTLFSHCNEHTRGGTKVMFPIFFSETVITITMKCTLVMGTYFKKLRLFSTKSPVSTHFFHHCLRLCMQVAYNSSLECRSSSRTLWCCVRHSKFCNQHCFRYCCLRNLPQY